MSDSRRRFPQTSGIRPADAYLPPPLNAHVQAQRAAVSFYNTEINNRAKRGAYGSNPPPLAGPIESIEDVKEKARQNGVVWPGVVPDPQAPVDKTTLPANGNSAPPQTAPAAQPPVAQPTAPTAPFAPSAPAAITTTQDALRHFTDPGTTGYANGGYATVGVADQNAPADGGTGISREGVPIVKNAQGAFVPAAGPPATFAATARDVPSFTSPNPAVAASAVPPTLDADSQKAIVAAYPEIGNAGSYANTTFRNSLKPGVNSLADAQGALQRIIAPPSTVAPAPAIAQVPTLPSPSFSPQTGFGANTPNTRNPNNPSALPAGTAAVVTPDAPAFSLATGAPAATATDPASAGLSPRLVAPIQDTSFNTMVKADDLNNPSEPTGIRALFANDPSNNPAPQNTPNSRAIFSSPGDLVSSALSRLTALPPGAHQQPSFDANNDYGRTTPTTTPATRDSLASSAQALNSPLQPQTQPDSIANIGLPSFAQSIDNYVSAVQPPGAPSAQQQQPPPITTVPNPGGDIDPATGLPRKKLVASNDAS